MHHRWIAIAACSAAAALVAPAGAQQMPLGPSKASDPRGFFVHGHVEGVQFSPDGDAAEDLDSEYGYGAGAQLGYNFTRYFGVFGALDYARHSIEGGSVTDDEFGIEVNIDDKARFTHVELGGRLNVPIGQTLLPYIDVAYARRTLKQDFSVRDEFTDADGTVELRGDNVLVGLGFQLFFRPTLAFDLGGRLSTGEFNNVTVTSDGESQSTDDDTGAEAQFARLTAGLTWYPGARSSRR